MPDPVVGNYGDQHVRVYDRLYGARFTPDAAVAALVAAAGPDGRLLEMGIGTGRLAVPLAERGLRVDGIEASTALITQFRDQRDNPGIAVFHADLADFDLPRKDYAVAVCAVSTLFMLPGPVDQASCLASVSVTCAQGVACLSRPFGRTPLGPAALKEYGGSSIRLVDAIWRAARTGGLMWE